MWGGVGGVFCSRARVCVSERWSTSNVSVLLKKPASLFSQSGILDFRPPRLQKGHVISPSWFELLLSVTCPRWSVRTFLCLTPSHPSSTSTSPSIWTRGLISRLRLSEQHLVVTRPHVPVVRVCPVCPLVSRSHRDIPGLWRSTTDGNQQQIHLIPWQQEMNEVYGAERAR